jgi:hypothetical protein
VEEVDEHAFLFRGKGDVDMHHLAVGAARVDEDLLGVLDRPERSRKLLGVERLLIDHLMGAGSPLEAMIVEASS